MRSRSSVPLALVASVLAMSACSDSAVEPIPPGASIQIQPRRDTLYVSDSLVQAKRFVATAYSAAGAPIEGQEFEWSSSERSVAIVDDSGLVTAVAPGSATISAKAGERATATVVVLPLTDRLDVTVTPHASEFVAGDTVDIAAVALDRVGEVAPGVIYLFESSDEAVATVDDTGLVVTRGAGNVTITVSANFQTVDVPLVVHAKQFLSVANTLSASADYNCGLIPLGRLYCWGLNDAGQLAAASDSVCFGDAGGTTAQGPCALVPFRGAENLALTTISAGWKHACGLTAAQRAYCWGSDAEGQLGRGGTGGGDDPIPVVGNLDFVSVTAGGAHTCGIIPGGKAYCWGLDASGQLGYDRFIRSTTPIPVKDTIGGVQLRFDTLALGLAHTCGLLADGTAYCWGSNSDGQLGTGSIGGVSGVPVAVATALRFTALTADGVHTCGLTTTGQTYCWGGNASGQLGSGGTAASGVPVHIASDPGFIMVDAGARHTCAITGAGAAFCWGADDYGQIGNDYPESASVTQPTPVVHGLVFTTITAGQRHSCGMTATNAYCWGSDVFGALGNHLQAMSFPVPNPVAPLR